MSYFGDGRTHPHAPFLQALILGAPCYLCAPALPEHPGATCAPSAAAASPLEEESGGGKVVLAHSPSPLHMRGWGRAGASPEHDFGDKVSFGGVLFCFVLVGFLCLYYYYYFIFCNSAWRSWEGEIWR